MGPHVAGRTKRIIAAAACALAVSGALAHSAPPAAPPVWPCDELAVSPEFVTDRTAFCAGAVVDRSTRATTGVAVWRTTDGGRTWSRQAAAGLLVTNPNAKVDHLAVSPLYKTDRTVFVQLTGTGLFSSIDGGATFTVVSPLAWGALTPYAATAPGGLLPAEGVHALYVMARPADEEGSPNGSALIDPITKAYTPVTGTPGRDAAFAVSDTFARDNAAFAVANHGVGLDAYVGIYRCTATFSCSERLQVFPKRWTFDRIWLAPDFRRSRTIYVSMTTVTGARSLWWSRNAGATWTRFSAAERLLAATVDAKVSPAIAFAWSGRYVYLRVSAAGSPRTGPPAEQLYRSADGGATWRLFAYGRSATQVGSRGTMPTDALPLETGDGRAPRGRLTGTADGRLFLLGSTWVYKGFYCSANAGRAWARLCTS